jgi:hypothetical protein
VAYCYSLRQKTFQPLGPNQNVFVQIWDELIYGRQAKRFSYIPAAFFIEPALPKS